MVGTNRKSGSRGTWAWQLQSGRIHSGTASSAGIRPTFDWQSINIANPRHVSCFELQGGSHDRGCSRSAQPRQRLVTLIGRRNSFRILIFKHTSYGHAAGFLHARLKVLKFSKTIARITLLEALRSRLAWVGLVGVGLTFGIAQFLTQVAMIEVAQIQIAVMAALMRATGVFVVAAFCITSLIREANDKITELLLSQPAPRWEYYLGKLGGCAGVAIVLAVCFSVPLAIHAPALQVAIWANGLKPSLRWKKGRASVVTWAMCILKKKILDLERAYYRKKKRKVRYLSLKVDSDGNIPEDVADKSPSAIEYLIRDETVEKVRDAITKVPKKIGKILWKKHIEKMKSRQIAIMLGMSQTSVHRRLMEGNELLVQILGGDDLLME